MQNSYSKSPHSDTLVFKVIIIGDAGCGKSAILHQFVEGKFAENSNKHTIGVEFGSKTIALPGKSI